MFQFTYSTTIEELRQNDLISQRSANCCAAIGITCIQDLVNFKTINETFLNIKNCGKKSVLELDSIIEKTKAAQTLNDNETGDKLSCREKAGILYDDLTIRCQVQLSRFYDLHKEKIIDKNVLEYVNKMYPTSKDLYIDLYCKRNNIIDLNNTLSNSEKYQLYSFIYNTFADFKNSLQSYEKTNSTLFVKEILELLQKKQSDLYYLNAFDSISPIIDRILRIEYKELVGNIPSRAKKVISESFPHYKDILSTRDYSFENFKNFCPGNSMKKTVTDLTNLRDNFIQVFKNTFSNSELFNLDIYIDKCYTFLGDDDKLFCKNFWLNYMHLPMLYILKKFLETSQNNKIRAYYIYYIQNEGNITYELVGNLIGLSGTRANDLVNDIDSIKKLLFDVLEQEDWINYPELRYDFCNEYSPIYLELNEKENLSLSFYAFLNIVRLVAPVILCKVKDYLFSISQNVNDKWKIIQLVEKIEEEIDSPHSEDVEKHISMFNDDINFVTYSENKTLQRIIIEIIEKGFKTSINCEGNILLPHNSINIEEYIKNILEIAGEPLSPSDIYKKIIETHPEIKKIDENKVHRILSKSPIFVPIGKTKKYALDNWDHINRGSIRDIIFDLLQNEDVPLLVDDIYTHVSFNYPETTIRSILSSCFNDKRFTLFKGNFIGLSSVEYDDIYEPIAKRLTFEEQLDEFENFIKVHCFFPRSNSGDKKEETLYHWYYRIKKNKISSTEEQKKELELIVQSFIDKGYPSNSSELLFLQECNRIRDFVKENNILPSRSKGHNYFVWLNKHKKIYMEYNDQRKAYFSKLIVDLRSWGYNL